MPWWVQAICTAVNEAGVLVAASRTTIRPLVLSASPTLSNRVVRSILKLTPVGGSPPVTPSSLVQAARQAVHTAATEKPRVDMKCLRCIFFSYELRATSFELNRDQWLIAHSYSLCNIKKHSEPSLGLTEL